MPLIHAKQLSPAGTYYGDSRWGADYSIQVDVYMHDITMWHSKRLIFHANCWVRESLHSRMID